MPIPAGTLVRVKPTPLGLRAAYPAANWIQKPEVVRLTEAAPSCRSLDVVYIERVLSPEESQIPLGEVQPAVYDFNIADPMRLPIIGDQAHFDKVMAYAQSRGLGQHLREHLDWLANFGIHDEKDRSRFRAQLWPDFAPWSFYWEVQVMGSGGVWSRFMNGGLIYFGPRDGGGSGAPQFSVRLVNSGEGWEVHT